MKWYLCSDIIKQKLPYPNLWIRRHFVGAAVGFSTHDHLFCMTQFAERANRNCFENSADVLGFFFFFETLNSVVILDSVLYLQIFLPLKMSVTTVNPITDLLAQCSLLLHTKYYWCYVAYRLFPVSYLIILSSNKKEAEGSGKSRSFQIRCPDRIKQK